MLTQCQQLFGMRWIALLFALFACPARCRFLLSTSCSVLTVVNLVLERSEINNSYQRRILY